MQIYELLKKQHQEVADLFKEVRKCLDHKNYSGAEKLFDKIKIELTSHAKAEQEVFYQPLKLMARDEKGQALAWEGEEEHHVICLLLNELSRISADEEVWSAKIKVLCEIVEHHVKEEENEIFPRAKRVFSVQDAEEIAVNMKELQELYRGMVDRALSEDLQLLLTPKMKDRVSPQMELRH